VKDFVNELSERLDIKRTELVEKDVIIQKLLIGLYQNDFSRNLVFKGGTCLIKCYLDYFRFSEDIDFTWRDQSVFEDKSQTTIRKTISGYVDELGKLLVNMSEKQGLDFVLDKNDRNYVEFGGGNKTVTYKIWFESEILKTRSFVKIQINFIEKIIFDVIEKKVNCLLSGKTDKELQALFPEDYDAYAKDISLYVYDVKEILCEKVRAILTRRGLKARDFVDIYLICNHFKLSVVDFRDIVLDKTRFMLVQYEKYRRNLEEKRRLIDSGEIFQWGDERNLLLIDIGEKGFYSFVRDFEKFLKDVLGRL